MTPPRFFFFGFNKKKTYFKKGQRTLIYYTPRHTLMEKTAESDIYM